MKRKFTKDEDTKICQLVNQHGAKNWDQIAQKIPGRTGRQCRDRYRNYLVPGFFNGQWTQEEDELLYEKFNQMGRQWSKMKKFFPGRSANSLRNRWNYFVCRLKDEQKGNNESLNINFQCSNNNIDNNPNGINCISIYEVNQKEIGDKPKNTIINQLTTMHTITIEPKNEEKTIYGVNACTQTNESYFSDLK